MISGIIFAAFIAIVTGHTQQIAVCVDAAGQVLVWFGTYHTNSGGVQISAEESVNGGAYTPISPNPVMVQLHASIFDISYLVFL